MDKAISAAEANRGFSRLLRQVAEGDSFVVTSHGRPVARIVPCAVDPTRAAARETLGERLGSQSVTDIGRWTRDDLYER